MDSSFYADRQNKLAEQFHALHHAEEMLVLPNSWDCASAKLIEAAGFPAVATTSAGVAWSCGYQDGEHIPPHTALEAVQRIARVVKVPVTADIEAGYYADDLEKLPKFFEALIEAGAVGVNLEDSDAKTDTLRDPNYQAQIIRLAKEAGKKKGVHLFVNARTDVMALTPGTLAAKVQAGLARAKVYEAAGADGIFVPFIQDLHAVEELKKELTLPLNILMAASLKAEDLRRLKVNRVSVGGKPMLAALQAVRKIATALKEGDDWSPLYAPEPTYGEVNAWFG